MASISTDKRGYTRILFIGTDGKRRTIRLGKCGRKQAELFRAHIERITAAQRTGSAISKTTAAWLSELTSRQYDALVRAGLADEQRLTTLGAFLDEYIATCRDLKPATLVVYGHSRRNLVDFFGYDTPLASISEGDAEKWRRWLIYDQELSDNTVRRRCGMAKQFFRAAIQHRYIDRNPFEHLSSTVRGNREKFYFVTVEESERVLDACPDAEWRLIFALSRFGGLRCPSEHAQLKWSDVHWGADAITVRSPKTEHHPGKESRSVPIFADLRPYLEEAYELAEPGAVYVVPRCRQPGVNLRTQLERIIQRAGLTPWPKLFHNLRATRQCELSDRFPEYQVCEWVGNTPDVAKEHYLRVRSEHFRNAAQFSAGDRVAQNPAHTGRHSSAMDGNASQRFDERIAENAEKPAISTGFRPSQQTDQWAILDSNQ